MVKAYKINDLMDMDGRNRAAIPAGRQEGRELFTEIDDRLIFTSR